MGRWEDAKKKCPESSETMSKLPWDAFPNITSNKAPFGSCLLSRWVCASSPFTLNLSRSLWEQSVVSIFVIRSSGFRVSLCVSSHLLSSGWLPFNQVHLWLYNAAFVLLRVVDWIHGPTVTFRWTKERNSVLCKLGAPLKPLSPHVGWGYQRGLCVCPPLPLFSTRMLISVWYGKFEILFDFYCVMGIFPNGVRHAVEKPPYPLSSSPWIPFSPYFNPPRFVTLFMDAALASDDSSDTYLSCLFEPLVKFMSGWFFFFFLKLVPVFAVYGRVADEMRKTAIGCCVCLVHT